MHLKPLLGNKYVYSFGFRPIDANEDVLQNLNDKYYHIQQFYDLGTKKRFYDFGSHKRSGE